MKVKKRKVYYCDYCKKCELTLQSMRLHEKHCTKNPNRQCRLCGATSTPQGLQISVEHGAMVPFVPEKTFREIEQAAGGCPVCIFSIFRQAEIPLHYVENYEELAQEWLRDE